MEVLAVIPARGGSKGIPGKNLCLLDGKPLVAHSILAAKNASRVTRVAVSTDDQEISKAGEFWGAEIVTRPSELSGDTASSESALLHTLDYYWKKERYQPDLLVFLQCTSPLTLPADIDNCIDKMLSERADSSFTGFHFHYFLWREGSDGSAKGINHDPAQRLLRQQKTPEFLENGAVYVMKTSGFIEHKHRFFGRIIMSEMPEFRSFEIDEPHHLDMVKLLWQHQTNS